MSLPASFCVLPWIHLSTRTNGEMQVCCSANSGAAYLDGVHKPGSIVHDEGGFVNLSRHSAEDGWNSRFLRGIRRAHLAGEKPVACTKCWRDEELGHRSKRQWENEYWNRHVDPEALARATDADGSAPLRVHYLDIKLGTKCNLKCATCSPHESSAWVADWKRLTQSVSPELARELPWQPSSYGWYKNADFWRQFERVLPELRQIYVIGGEPTLIEDYYHLLESCVASGHAAHLELRHNTNGTELNDRLIGLWRRFKKVTLHLSLDATGPRNDYLRFPSRWTDMLAQLERFDSLGAPITVNLDLTVSMLNIFHLPDMIAWKLASPFKNINRYPEGGGLIGLHFLYLPRFLGVRALPPSAKAALRTKYESLIQTLPDVSVRHPSGAPKLRALLRYMDSADDSHLLPQAREYLAGLDTLRGTSWQTTFPELEKFIQP